MLVLLILGLGVPIPSICVGTSDPRTRSTHVIEQELCAPWWVLLLLGLRVPTSSISVGISDPRTGSTHVIEARIMCALLGTPAPRTESTHL